MSRLGRLLRAGVLPIHDRLVVHVTLAAAAGLLLPTVASRLSGAVPVLLAGQVLGVALTLTAGQLVAAIRRPLPIALALLVQWTVLPLMGLLLYHVIPDRLIGTGILLVAVAPAEITSALVAVLARGSGAVAAACMAGSLALGTVLTPLWVTYVLGGDAAVDRAALIGELALAVVLPLLVGAGLRSTLPVLARHAPRALDLSAVCVVLVVFVSVGASSTLVASAALITAVAACLALLVAGYLAGAGVGWATGRRTGVGRALLFPVGMREFGIAATVALAVNPAAVGVAGVYGALLMVASPMLARRVRRQARLHR